MGSVLTYEETGDLVRPVPDLHAHTPTPTPAVLMLPVRAGFCGALLKAVGGNTQET